ncbi:hypothetical protein BJ878DRAFT_499234 [Calycina marina]|uniref:Uncharacterized protein n=1 Tax=Calycina marina TaxID=1763456 RepID=A0A9P8CG74_9HELO|nr:hypothetical protein BJ878DRAFT_499234 [Calycina marina]
MAFIQWCLSLVAAKPPVLMFYKCGGLPPGYSLYMSPSIGFLNCPRSWVASINSAALTTSLGVLKTSPKANNHGPRCVWRS